jgi:hypothetical protein
MLSQPEDAERPSMHNNASDYKSRGNQTQQTTVNVSRRRNNKKETKAKKAASSALSAKGTAWG